VNEARRNGYCILAATLCSLAWTRSHELAAEEPVAVAEAAQGLWSGTWGQAVDASGAVHQPVIAELFVKGRQIELQGFPQTGRNGLTGIVSFDAKAKRMQITPTGEADGRPATRVVYRYEIEGDAISLTDNENRTIVLRRHRVLQEAAANIQIELVEATGVNAEGDLLVREFSVLEVGRSRANFYEPTSRLRKTRGASLLQVQEDGCQTVTIDQVRRRIRKPTLVAIAYRHDDRRQRPRTYRLWNQVGPPAPDSQAAQRTLSRVLQPGTLVFVLPARESIPQP
jgi:hypothetical protein